MPPFNPDHYGPAFAPLLAVDRCRSLGPGQPDPSVRPVLSALEPTRAFAGRSIVDRQMADLCCGAVWLFHDFLEESHAISQSADARSGSYWHGIMHRREPDYGNAGYWFRRVGEHPMFARLLDEARRLAAEADVGDAAELLAAPRWDPFAFIDLCESAYRRSTAGELLCRQIQQRECELLFDFCYRRAVGE